MLADLTCKDNFSCTAFAIRECNAQDLPTIRTTIGDEIITYNVTYYILRRLNLGKFKQGVSKHGVMTFHDLRGDRDRSTMSAQREVPTVHWQAIVARNLVVLQQGEDATFV